MMFSQSMRRNALRLEGERSSALDLARGRLVLMCGFFVLVYVIFAIRAFDLSVIQAQAVQLPSHELAQVEVPANNIIPSLERRADILDRNGALLATTLKTSALFAD